MTSFYATALLGIGYFSVTPSFLPSLLLAPPRLYVFPSLRFSHLVCPVLFSLTLVPEMEQGQKLPTGVVLGKVADGLKRDHSNLYVSRSLATMLRLKKGPPHRAGRPIRTQGKLSANHKPKLISPNIVTYSKRSLMAKKIECCH